MISTPEMRVAPLARRSRLLKMLRSKVKPVMCEGAALKDDVGVE